MPFADSDGVKIHYRIEGSGPALLLGHGFSSNLDMWQSASFYPALRERFTVIPFDARGHGKSDKPIYAEAYSIRARVRDALAVLEDAGVESANYFGYSMGGWLGYLLAINADERFGRFVIGASHLLFDDWSATRDQLSLGREGYIAELLKQDPNTAADRLERARTNNLQALKAVQFDRPDLTADIPKIKKPLLIYAGDADPKYEKFKQSADMVQSASFLTIPGADHAGGFTETPQVLDRILAFLDGE